MEAAAIGNKALLQEMVTSGGTINTHDESGQSLLIEAARHGHLPIVQYLIEQGADIAHADKKGWNALHAAAYEGHMDIATYLVDNGAKLDSKDSEGRTPLHWCSIYHDGDPDLPPYARLKGTDKGGSSGGEYPGIAFVHGKLAVA